MIAKTTNSSNPWAQAFSIQCGREPNKEELHKYLATLDNLGLDQGDDYLKILGFQEGYIARITEQLTELKEYTDTATNKVNININQDIDQIRGQLLNSLGLAVKQQSFGLTKRLAAALAVSELGKMLLFFIAIYLATILVTIYLTSAIVKNSIPANEIALPAAEYEAIINCNKDGWQLRNDICYPHSASDGTLYGWRISK